MKMTMLRQLGAVCGLALLFFGSPKAQAFCTETTVLGVPVNCGGEGHIRVTGYISPILRGDIWNAIWDGNYSQDQLGGDFRTDGQRHMESCRFRDAPVSAQDSEIRPGSIEYIRSAYRNAINYLDPAAPDPMVAADRFGKLLHTVQDFYSHTNWINLVRPDLNCTLGLERLHQVVGDGIGAAAFELVPVDERHHLTILEERD